MHSANKIENGSQIEKEGAEMQEHSLCGRKRIAAGVLAFLILSVLLFSAFFIVFEADHDCAGEEHCSICYCIEQCTNALLQVRFGYGTAFRNAAVLFLFLLTAAALHHAAVFKPETPVSRKVQLND